MLEGLYLNMKMSAYVLTQIVLSLAVITLTISIGIGAYFVYSHWYLKRDVTCAKFGACTQTTI